MKSNSGCNNNEINRDEEVFGTKESIPTFKNQEGQEDDNGNYISTSTLNADMLSPMDFKEPPNSNMLKAVIDLGLLTDTNNDSTIAQENLIRHPASTTDIDNFAFGQAASPAWKRTRDGSTAEITALAGINPIVLTDNDVLVGRGPRSNKHPGNKRFRKLVLENKSRYFAQGKSKKNKMTSAVAAVENIQ